MEVSDRQAKRLYQRYRAEDAKGLKHRSAGRASRSTLIRGEHEPSCLATLSGHPSPTELLGTAYYFATHA